jgi:hypothetical protein
MDGRIGTLDLRYLTNGTNPLVAAGLPALTRALERDLAEALDARLTALLGHGREVFVVRELRAETTLAADALALEAPVVEGISRAYADAIVDRLIRPDDDVVRFQDQAEFVTAFIIDEIEAPAADRWYFGAFRKYRRANAGSTIDAVLAAHPMEVPGILARLARGGRLDAVLALVGASRLLDLATPDDASAPGSDVGVLVDAALQLVALLGWSLERHVLAASRHLLLQEYASERIDWASRAQLTDFVWMCAERAADMLRARGLAPGPVDPDALREALCARFDWLDVPELLRRAESQPPEAQVPPPSAATDVFGVVFGRILSAVRDGRVTVGRDEDVAVVLTRLIASADVAPFEVSCLPRLRRALSAIVDGWRRAAGADHADRGLPGGGTSDVRGVRDATGASASDLIDALDTMKTQLDEAGQPTTNAGLYLLIRAVVDAGLPGLALRHGVPFPALMAGLAQTWLGQTLVSDAPLLAWAGTDTEADVSVERLEAEALVALERDLKTRLRDQRAIPSDPGSSTGDHDVQASTSLDRMANMLVRAWARWLPALAESSQQFLLDRMIRRGGDVDIGESRVTVTLDPAPFDVVLQMAGYFKPLEAVPWLGGRSVAFDIARRSAV